MLKNTKSKDPAVIKQPSKLISKAAAKSVTKNTAGTLLYRKKKDKLEVLLVHPAGNYNRKAAWSIPKGQSEKMESFEETARRETMEETGIIPEALKPLGYIDYTKSRKRVHCFYGQAPQGATPKNISWEVDKAEFMPLERAMKAIHQDQLQLLERLQFILKSL
jgi:predicted NUDIX family NTP pyrophosphohydrolase